MNPLPPKEKPLIRLTNWARTKGGREIVPETTFTIMARPRAWEHGAGWVAPLVPAGEAMGLLGAALEERARGTGVEAMRKYRAAYVRQITDAAHLLTPGALSASLPSGEGYTLEAGATLCCACSADDARAGRCHRAWAAPHLLAAGWRVILDGVEVRPPEVQRAHKCHAWGCDRPCPPAHLMCGECWGMVDRRTQAEVYRTVALRGPHVDHTWAAWWRAQAIACAEVASQRGMGEAAIRIRMERETTTAATLEARVSAKGAA